MDATTKPKRKSSASASSKKSPYPDLHDHVRALEKAGQLIRVDRPINKDTEMHPLVRWQFRGGIEEKDRKAFLFTNVTDSKGRKYDIPVLVGGLAANREIYRIGIGCEFDQIDPRWVKAAQNPLPPRVVTNAPCHEIVITGKDLDKPGQGLDGLPAADFDAGLGRRALHHAVAIHHQGSRHRRAEHGQLPRPGEGAAAARHEPVAGIAAGHLQPLGKAAQRAASRNCPARWCSARRQPSRSRRCRSCRRRSTRFTWRARWSARRSTW